jgi:hypothetical protein
MTMLINRVHVKLLFVHSVILAFGIFVFVSMCLSASSTDARVEGLRPVFGLTPACRVAQSYVSLVASLQTDAIVMLFADNTDYLGPDGVTRHHSSEIKAAFAKSFANNDGKPLQLKIASLVPNSDDSCLVQIEILKQETAEYMPLGIDHIQVNKEGKIIKLLPYCVTSQLAYCHSRLANKGDHEQ